MSVAVAAAGPVDDAGWHVLQIPIESIEAATAELLRFGPDVVAISPRPLVTALRHRTRELARLYSMPGGARKKR
jgi:predicted DNA-binding transcriptional regulator YafY